MPVIGCILGDQDQLAHTCIPQLARLVDDRLHRAGNGSSLDQGDRTERTRTAAPIRDLEVSTRARNRNPQRLVFIRADGFGLIRQMVQRLGMRTFSQVAHHLHDIHPAPRAQHPIDSGDFLRHLRAIPLGETARGDQDLVVPFSLRQLAQYMDRFFLRRADEPARIDDQYGRTGRVIHGFISIAQKKLRHRIGVDRILCTTEGDKMKGIF